MKFMTLEKAAMKLSRWAIAHFKKLTAVVTVSCFIVTGVCGQAISALSQGTEDTSSYKQAAENLFIPASIGRVTNAGYHGSDTVVITISNLHCHAEVQKNINSILVSLDEKYPLSRVYLEGAAGEIDAAWLKTLEPKMRSKLLETLIGKGELSGAEYFAVNTSKNTKFLGLENEKVYRENSLRLGKITDNQAEVNAIIEQMGAKLEAVKNEYYNPSQKNLEKLIKEHRDGKLNSVKYYHALKKYADSLNIDVNGYRNLARFEKLLGGERDLNYRRISAQMSELLSVLKNRLPYAAYQSVIEQATKDPRHMEGLYRTLARMVRNYNIDISGEFPELNHFFSYIRDNQEINPISLIRDENRLLDEINHAMASNESERDVAFLLDFFRNFSDYFNNKISADDYEYFSSNLNEFKVQYESYTNDTSLARLDPYFETLNAYYQTNLERNHWFIRNMLGENTKCNTGAVKPVALFDNIENTINDLPKAKEIIVTVTGGFHTPGLEKLLDEKGISYLSITPNVTQEAKYADAIYWEKIYEQNVIFSQTMERLLLLAADTPVQTRVAVVLGVVFADNTSERAKEQVANEVLTELKKNPKSGLAGRDFSFRLTGKNEKDNETFVVSSDGKESSFEYNAKEGTPRLIDPEREEKEALAKAEDRNAFEKALDAIKEFFTELFGLFGYESRASLADDKDLKRWATEEFEKMTLFDIPKEELRGKVVNVRVDWNISGDDITRITETLDTIRYLQEAGAKIVIMAHFKRPNEDLDELVKLYMNGGYSKLLKKEIPGGLTKEEAKKEAEAHRPLIRQKATLAPVVAKFRNVMPNAKVTFKPEYLTNFDAWNDIQAMNGGDILVLENSRFSDAETVLQDADKALNKAKKGKDAEALKEAETIYAEAVKASDELSTRMYFGTDAVVVESIGVSHRLNVTVMGKLNENVPRVAGFGLLKEKRYLDVVKESVEINLLGGLKVKDKIDVLQNPAPGVKKTLIGGAMLNAFLKAKGIEVGSSAGADADSVKSAKALLSDPAVANRLVFAKDVVIVKGYDIQKVDPKTKEYVVADIVVDENGNWKLISQGEDFTQWTVVEKVKDENTGEEKEVVHKNAYIIADIGSKSVEEFTGIIKGMSKGKSIFWNGAMGAFDLLEIAENGTRKMVDAMVSVSSSHDSMWLALSKRDLNYLNKVLTGIGGGQSIEAAEKYDTQEQLNIRFTGGGASIEYLGGKPLPGIIGLTNKKDYIAKDGKATVKGKEDINGPDQKTEKGTGAKPGNMLALVALSAALLYIVNMFTGQHLAMAMPPELTNTMVNNIANASANTTHVSLSVTLTNGLNAVSAWIHTGIPFIGTAAAFTLIPLRIITTAKDRMGRRQRHGKKKGSSLTGRESSALPQEEKTQIAGGQKKEDSREQQNTNEKWAKTKITDGKSAINFLHEFFREIENSRGDLGTKEKELLLSSIEKISPANIIGGMLEGKKDKENDNGTITEGANLEIVVGKSGSFESLKDAATGIPGYHESLDAFFNALNEIERLNRDLDQLVVHQGEKGMAARAEGEVLRNALISYYFKSYQYFDSAAVADFKDDPRVFEPARMWLAQHAAKLHEAVVEPDAIDVNAESADTIIAHLKAKGIELTANEKNSLQKLVDHYTEQGVAKPWVFDVLQLSEIFDRKHFIAAFGHLTIDARLQTVPSENTTEPLTRLERQNDEKLARYKLLREAEQEFAKGYFPGQHTTMEELERLVDEGKIVFTASGGTAFTTERNPDSWTNGWAHRILHWMEQPFQVIFAGSRKANGKAGRQIVANVGSGAVVLDGENIDTIVNSAHIIIPGVPAPSVPALMLKALRALESRQITGKLFIMNTIPMDSSRTDEAGMAIKKKKVIINRYIEPLEFYQKALEEYLKEFYEQEQKGKITHDVVEKEEQFVARILEKAKTAGSVGEVMAWIFEGTGNEVVLSMGNKPGFRIQKYETPLPEDEELIFAKNPAAGRVAAKFLTRVDKNIKPKVTGDFTGVRDYEEKTVFLAQYYALTVLNADQYRKALPAVKTIHSERLRKLAELDAQNIISPAERKQLAALKERRQFNDKLQKFIDLDAKNAIRPIEKKQLDAMREKMKEKENLRPLGIEEVKQLDELQKKQDKYVEMAKPIFQEAMDSMQFLADTITGKKTAVKEQIFNVAALEKLLKAAGIVNLVSPAPEKASDLASPVTEVAAEATRQIVTVIAEWFSGKAGNDKGGTAGDAGLSNEERKEAEVVKSLLTTKEKVKNGEETLTGIGGTNFNKGTGFPSGWAAGFIERMAYFLKDKHAILIAAGRSEPKANQSEEEMKSLPSSRILSHVGGKFTSKIEDGENIKSALRADVIAVGVPADSIVATAMQMRKAFLENNARGKVIMVFGVRMKVEHDEAGTIEKQAKENAKAAKENRAPKTVKEAHFNSYVTVPEYIDQDFEKYINDLKKAATMSDEEIGLVQKDATRIIEEAKKRGIKSTGELISLIMEGTGNPVVNAGYNLPADFVPNYQLGGDTHKPLPKVTIEVLSEDTQAGRVAGDIVELLIHQMDRMEGNIKTERKPLSASAAGESRTPLNAQYSALLDLTPEEFDSHLEQGPTGPDGMPADGILAIHQKRLDGKLGVDATKVEMKTLVASIIALRKSSQKEPALNVAAVKAILTAAEQVAAAQSVAAAAAVRQLPEAIVPVNGKSAREIAQSVVRPFVSDELKNSDLAGQGLIRIDGNITAAVRKEIGMQADRGMNVVAVTPWDGVTDGKTYIANIPVTVDGKKLAFKVWAEIVPSRNNALILSFEDYKGVINKNDAEVSRLLQMQLLGQGTLEIINKMQQDKVFAEKLNIAGLPFEIGNGKSRPAILQVNGKSGVFALPALTNDFRGMAILKNVVTGYRNDPDDAPATISLDLMKMFGIETNLGSNDGLDLASFGENYADVNVSVIGGMSKARRLMDVEDRITDEILGYEDAYNIKKKQNDTQMNPKPGVGVLARVGQLIPHRYNEDDDIGRGTTAEVPGYSSLTREIGFDNLQLIDVLGPGESLEFNTLNIDPRRVPEIDVKKWIAAIKDASQQDGKAAARIIPQLLAEGFKTINAYKDGNWSKKQRYNDFSLFLAKRGFKRTEKSEEDEATLLNLYGQWLIRSQWRIDLKNTRNAVLPEQRVFDVDSVKELVDTGFAGARLNLKEAHELLTGAELARLRAAVPKATILVVPPANAPDGFMAMVRDNNLKYVYQVKRSEMKKAMDLVNKENVVLEMVPEEGITEEFKTVAELEKAVEEMMNSGYPDVNVNSKLLEAVLSDDPELRERTAGEMKVSRSEVIRMWSKLIGMRLSEPLSIERIRARAFAEGRAIAPKLSPEALAKAMEGLKGIRTKGLGQDGRVVSHGLYIIPAVLQDLSSLEEKGRGTLEDLVNNNWFFDEFTKVMNDQVLGRAGSKEARAWDEVLDYVASLRREALNATDSGGKLKANMKLAEFVSGLMVELVARRYPSSNEIKDPDENAKHERLAAITDSFIGKDGSGTTILAGDAVNQMIAIKGAMLSAGRFEEAQDLLAVFARNINSGNIKDTVAQLLFVEAVYEHYAQSKDMDLSLIFSGSNKQIITAMKKAVAGYQAREAYDIGTELLYHEAFGVINELTAKNGERDAMYAGNAVMSEKKIEKIARDGITAVQGITSTADFIAKYPFYAASLSHNKWLFTRSERMKLVKAIENLGLYSPYGLRAEKDGVVFPAMIGAYIDLKTMVMIDEGKTVPEIQREAKLIAAPLLERLMKDGGIAEQLPADLSFGLKGRMPVADAVSELLRVDDTFSDQKLPDIREKLKEQFKVISNERTLRALLGAA